MRVINRTIRLRNIFLDRHAAMFDVPLFPKLRLPETFAGSKLLRLASKTRELSEGTRPRLQPHPSPATLTICYLIILFVIKTKFNSTSKTIR